MKAFFSCKIFLVLLAFSLLANANQPPELYEGGVKRTKRESYAEALAKCLASGQTCSPAWGTADSNYFQTQCFEEGTLNPDVARGPNCRVKGHGVKESNPKQKIFFGELNRPVRVDILTAKLLSLQSAHKECLENNFDCDNKAVKFQSQIDNQCYIVRSYGYEYFKCFVIGNKL